MNRSKTTIYLLGIGMLFLSLIPGTLSSQNLVCSAPNFQGTLSPTDCTAEILPGDAITPGSTLLPGYPDAFVVDLYYDMAKTMPVPTSPFVTASEIGVTVWVEVTYTPPNGDPSITCWTSTNRIEDKTDPVIECPCDDVDSYSSSLLGQAGPAFVRPDGDGTTCTENGGSDTHAYDEFVFSIEVPGVYTFSMEQLNGNNMYGLLYEGVFDPVNPCANFLIGNNDGGPDNEPEIIFTASPGTYTLITTHNGGMGVPQETDEFTWNFSGPGVVTEGACIFSCTDLSDLLDGTIPGPLPTAEDNCSAVTPTVNDVLVDGGCDPDTLRRTYTATDASDNSSSCTYDILILKPDAQDIEFPEEEILECNSASPPSTDPSDTGYPQVDDLDITNVVNDCGLFSSYSDDVTIPFMCPNGVLIIREWTVMRSCDWSEVASETQFIKIMDTTAPVFDNCPTEPIEVNASSEDCTASVILPIVTAADDCNTATLTPTISNGILSNNNLAAFGLPLGDTEVTVTAVDECDNEDVCVYTITAVDLTPPVVSCETFHTVGIVGDPTVVDASVFDDGSEDYCGAVSFLVRRMEGAQCTFIDFTEFEETAPFFCCDIGEDIMVELLVTDEAGNTNSCMVSVEVQDKLDPAIQCPPDKIIECDADTSPANTGMATAIDNCGSVTIGSSDSGGLNDCSEGTIVRTWTASDDNGNSSSCDQTIVVENSDPFDGTTDIECPVSLVDPGIDCTASTDPSVTGEPILTRDACDNLGMTAAIDEIILPEDNSIDDFLFKIQRTWTIVDWCRLDDAGDPEEYTCVQFIKVVDNDEPVFDCPPATTITAGADLVLEVTNIVDNCSDLADINVTYTIANTTITGDGPIISIPTGDGTELTEGDYQVTFVLVDEGFNSAECVIDVNVDGGMNNIVTCDIIDLDDFYNVNVGLTGNATLEADQPALYESVIPGNPTISLDGSPGSFSSSLIFSCGDIVNDEETMVSVILEFDNGIGGRIQCATSVVVVDNTSPVASCLGGDPTVTLSAGETYVFTRVDVDDGSFDVSCTTNPADLSFAMTPASVDCDYFLTNANPSVLPVAVVVTDKYGNEGMCTTNIRIETNDGVCGPVNLSSSVAGIIENEEGVEVEYVHIEASGGGMFEEMMTTETGDFSFDLPNADNYVITPDRNDDPLNGVSTLDLIRINQHILQVESLGSPYKIIAADINRSGEVTTFDLVNLRKLILHIDTEFANNTSWRFVDAGFVFPDPANPFITDFPEVYTINGLTEDMQADFVAIKVGDVNCSASANDLVGGGDDRSYTNPIHFRVDDQELKAGASYNIEFTLAEIEQLRGYQFSLHFDQSALSVEAVEAGALPGMTSGNFGLQLLDRGVVTTSWHTNEVLNIDEVIAFSMRFTARANTTLSEVISMSSVYTKAEAYTATDIASVDLAFATESGLVTKQFQLYQNRPNPFKGETVISFQLPESEAGVLTIYDLTGRVVKMIRRTFTTGYNEVALSSTDLAGDGVYFYRLEVADYSAMRKMILLQ